MSCNLQRQWCSNSICDTCLMHLYMALWHKLEPIVSLDWISRHLLYTCIDLAMESASWLPFTNVRTGGLTTIHEHMSALVKWPVRFSHRRNTAIMLAADCSIPSRSGQGLLQKRGHYAARC